MYHTQFISIPNLTTVRHEWTCPWSFKKSHVASHGPQCFQSTRLISMFINLSLACTYSWYLIQHPYNRIANPLHIFLPLSIVSGQVMTYILYMKEAVYAFGKPEKWMQTQTLNLGYNWGSGCFYVWLFPSCTLFPFFISPWDHCIKKLTSAIRTSSVSHNTSLGMSVKEATACMLTNIPSASPSHM